MQKLNVHGGITHHFSAVVNWSVTIHVMDNIDYYPSVAEKVTSLYDENFKFSH